MNSMSFAAPIAQRGIEELTDPSIGCFRAEYEQKRRPVVLRGLANDWPASKRWSLEYFRENFPTLEVTTIRTNAGLVVMDSSAGADQEKVLLEDFIESLQAGSIDRYLTTRMGELPSDLCGDLTRPALCSRSPWQNGNFWIGAAGTIARLHRDLPDNLHVLLSGRKRFTLISPSSSSRIYPNGILDPFPNGCKIDIEHPDFENYPKLRGVEALVAELEAGDAIYIPRNWWHHVRTLELSIAVNFWWAGYLFRTVVLAADFYKRVRGIGPLWGPRAVAPRSRPDDTSVPRPGVS
jgi:lysine-specific demethylase 8